MRYFFSILLVMLSLFAQSQTNQDKFGEFTYRQGSTYRTATGKPGPEYWQNKSDYEIAVTLDDKARTISGSVRIHYTNNSPESLDYLWLLLEQNRFKADSRGSLTLEGDDTRYTGEMTNGYDIKSVKVNNSYSLTLIITDTRMQVWLNEPVQANGGEIVLDIEFSYDIPETGVDRMGVLEVDDAEVYSIAQWYPQMAVLDDVDGWATLPYLGAGEFYLGYGDFDYKITVPYNHIVVGSGALQNPKEVLTKEQIKRLNKASKSDETIFIIKPEEVGKAETRPKASGNLTWHFKMNNTRDVAFASSPAFVWDAAKINLPSGKTALAQSVYPNESFESHGWNRSTEYTKAAIEFYSKNYYEYPYPVATNVASNVNGMEYPSVSFCKFSSSGEALWGVTDHEFGHNWFPMIVGSNERKHGWLDEGLNMFINHYSTESFNKGEYKSRVNLTQSARFFLQNPNRERVMTYSDILQEKNIGVAVYYKPALGFLMLREYIVGPERFDPAFKSYIKTWAYKHPRPEDFFNFMDNALGEDLSYFWQGWFYSNENIDIGITDIVNNETESSILLENNGLPIPVVLELVYEDNSVENLKLPVEIWHRGNNWKHIIETTKAIKSVSFDPEHKITDVNPANNFFEVGAE